MKELEQWTNINIINFHFEGVKDEFCVFILKKSTNCLVLGVANLFVYVDLC